MTSPYEGFPWQRPKRWCLGSVVHGQTLNAIEYILDGRGADLRINTPLDPKLVRDRLHLDTKGHKSAIGRSPCRFFKMALLR
jgi:hypothetical protein